MLLTLPGLPCLYTGGDVGAHAPPYGTIAPIDWADHFGLRPYVKRLIALRRTHPSLHSPHWRPLAIEPAAPIFGFLRYAGGDAAPVLVLLNFSGTDLTARLAPPAEFVAAAQMGSVVDLWTDASLDLTLSGELTIPVPAWDVRLLSVAGPMEATRDG